MFLAAAKMLEKIQTAVPARRKHVVEFRDFQATIPESAVAVWTTAVELWEKDGRINPFQRTKRSECFPSLSTGDTY